VITIDIANRQRLLPIDRAAIRRAVKAVLAGQLAGKTTISVAVVDDATISKLNAQFLGHRGPTDVISFVLEQGDGRFDGEVVASAETALRTAPQFGWSAGEELLLYVIHGALHLAGYDDATPRDRATMRRRETEYLAGLGIRAPHHKVPSSSRRRLTTRPPLPPGEGKN
jgi:probable rRNA maturation factor